MSQSGLKNSLRQNKRTSRVCWVDSERSVVSSEVSDWRYESDGGVQCGIVGWGGGENVEERQWVIDIVKKRLKEKKQDGGRRRIKRWGEERKNSRYQTVYVIRPERKETVRNRSAVRSICAVLQECSSWALSTDRKWCLENKLGFTVTRIQWKTKGHWKKMLKYTPL